MSMIDQNNRFPDAPWTEAESPHHVDVAQPNPLLKVHQLLRGKYHWGVLIGLVLGAAGAAAAYKAPALQPKYTSTGYVQIKPVVELIYGEVGRTREDVDVLLDAQVPALSSQRLLMHAMGLKKDKLALMDRKDIPPNMQLKAWDDQNWADVSPSWGKMASNEQLAKFTESLFVSRTSGTVLAISFRDRSPMLAAVAVKLVIAAYKDIYDQDAENMKARLAALYGKRITAAAQVKSYKESVKVIVGNYFSEEFFLRNLNKEQATLLDNKEIIRNVESQLQAMAMGAVRECRALFEEGRAKEAQMKLAPVLKVWPELFPARDDADQLRREIAAKLGSTEIPSQTTQTWMDLTPELAASDPEMAEALRNVKDAEKEYEFALMRGAPNSANVIAIRDRVTFSRNQVTQVLERIKLRLKNSRPGADGVMETSPGPGMVSLVDANNRLNSLREMNARLSDEIGILMERKAKLDVVLGDLARVQEDLDHVESAIHKLEFEGASTGRAEVISPGDIPYRADKDRRVPAAAGAAAAGLAAGLALVAVLGLFNRRLRNIADARESLDGSKRILGILPALPGDLTDPAQMSAVAFAVHHIRTLLQLGSGGNRGSVFAITSAAPQDGKTSLTTALGMSYAASGAKTLLIDADLIGGGLSHRLSGAVRPRIGSILVRKGIISSEQLDAGLEEAKQSGSRLGRVLVKLGFIKPIEKRQALAEQAASNLGILDMLDGRSLSDCVLSCGTPNLSIMPVGNIEAAHVGRMSVDSIRRIIDEARKEYHVVIFDTGPLLGSLEAGVVAASVDEVIVAVARGQQVNLLNQTFGRLKDLDARVAGVVFNRAQFEDIERSGYSSSVTSQRPQSPRPAARVDNEVVVERRLGPIASALTSTPGDEEDR